MVGHLDRMGLRVESPRKSWNSSHPSRGPLRLQPGGSAAARAAPGCSTASPRTDIRVASWANLGGLGWHQPPRGSLNF